MTTANKLTIVRTALIPFFIVAMYLKWECADYIALGIFIVASVTDFLDGYIARKYNQVTDFGKFMDPLADKLLVASAILLFIERGQMPAWAAVIVIAREFAVTALRLVAAGNGTVLAAALAGKIKTFSSIVCICVMLTPLCRITVAGNITVNTICVAVILITTVWSGAEYFIKNGRLLTASK